MNDDIRRALDHLVGQPPTTIGRRGAVMRRIERVRARRRVALQATLSAFLVASVAFGATRVISATPTSGDSLIELPSEKPDEQRKTVPVETPKPKPIAKPKPKKTVQPEPKPVYTKDPEPTYTKEPAPTYTKQPEPTYTKEPVGGLSVELWPYTDAYAGHSMDWKVKAYDPAGRLLRIEVLFGDGKKSVYEPASACGEGTAVKQFFSHTYAAAGTYTAKATVTTGGCGADTETKTVSSGVKVYAPATGNGPALPTVTAEQVEAGLALTGSDADGWVKKFWVDWGDGSESVVGPRPFDGCQDGKPSSWSTSASHAYAAPGTYTVKVTVMSTNCDAGQGQTKTISLTITV